MKSLYESLLAGKVSKPSAKVQPDSKEELRQLISEHIEEIKPRPGQEVDLNWIDISRVDNLSELFEDTKYIPVIDTWKIDHVKIFISMFAGNEYITRSPLPVLQEKLLSDNCYMGMFIGCTNLEEPPVLPAKKLTKRCYTSMFHGCTSLVYAPQLPATELAYSCYRSMFAGCRKLERAPELPAKILAPYCYHEMFENCSGLQTAPQLPATEMASECYAAMFYGCSNLKCAPELPATKLANRCYQDMFANCESLEERAKLPPGVTLDYVSTINMYRGCPNIK